MDEQLAAASQAQQLPQPELPPAPQHDALPPGRPPEPDAAPRPPRIWPALVVGFAFLPVVLVVSLAVLLPAAILSGAMHHGHEAWMLELARAPGGLVLLLAPSLLVCAGVALGAAALSPQPLTQRLALGRPALAAAGYLPLLAGTLLVMTLAELVAELMGGPSEMSRLLAAVCEDARGGNLLLLFLLIGVGPGLLEEMLFRGYIQSRLLRRWHPTAAIGLTTVLFAAAHFEPAHVVPVLPVGLWLGFVAWRSRSIWPAVGCHMFNNIMAVLLLAVGADGMIESLPVPVVVIFGGSAVLLLGWCGYSMVRGDGAPAARPEPAAEVDALQPERVE